MTFAVLADMRVKIKESEKTDKYLDIERELPDPRKQLQKKNLNKTKTNYVHQKNKTKQKTKTKNKQIKNNNSWWAWRWYQLLLINLERLSKTWKLDWGNGKSGEE